MRAAKQISQKEFQSCNLDHVPEAIDCSAQNYLIKLQLAIMSRNRKRFSNTSYYYPCNCNYFITIHYCNYCNSVQFFARISVLCIIASIAILDGIAIIAPIAILGRIAIILPSQPTIAIYIATEIPYNTIHEKILQIINLQQYYCRHH